MPKINAMPMKNSTMITTSVDSLGVGEPMDAMYVCVAEKLVSFFHPVTVIDDALCRKNVFDAALHTHRP